MGSLEPDVARLNLADNREVDVLCACFSCDRVDVYVAVAMVGDVLNDIRRYLTRALGPRPERNATSPALRVITSLLPAWPSIPECPRTPRGQCH